MSCKYFDRGFEHRGIKAAPVRPWILFCVLITASSVNSNAAAEPIRSILQTEQGATLASNGDESTMLTEKERGIAKTLGYDEHVMIVLKESLSPEMGIVKTGGLEKDESDFRRKSQGYVAPLLEKDKQAYKRIRQEHPELAPLVDEELKSYDQESHSNRLESDAGRQQMISQLGQEKYERYNKFRIAMEPYFPLMAQQAQRDHPGISSHGFIDDPEALASDAALDKAIADIKREFAGQTLDESNKGKAYLCIKFWGTGGSRYEPDRRVAKLRSSLEEIGYRFSEESRGEEEAKMFEDKSSAEAYLRSTGTDVDSSSLQEQKASTFEVLYPQQQNSEHTQTNSPAFRLLPGAIVKKTGDRRWSIDQPTRYTARSYRRIASIMKVPKGSVGFDLVRAKRTAGTNYDISSQMVIDKLQYWNKEYGVVVIEAGRDNMTVRFEKLPKDLSHLCTELFLFCPDLIKLSDDENQNAGTMREFAKHLRRDGEVQFWWD